MQETLDGVLHPAQFDALDRQVDLVTIGIGGNDLGLFSTLLQGCSALAAQGGSGGSTTPTSLADGCTPAVRRQARESLAQIQRTVAAAFTGVVDRAPKARVLAVGYPQVVPEDGTCAELPLAEADYGFARSINEGLSDAIEEAAADAGVEYVDLWKITAGHDVCSDDPWINGSSTDPGAALAFHPFAEEQQAVAEQILEILG
ncbi:unannotated protein [freshwater metagenome]|uniref:Unannotated protein n=1 Tax=freshwater metagenome TaxID=449393 RepID=A0A6J6QQY9_9ZZZZ